MISFVSLPCGARFHEAFTAHVPSVTSKEGLILEVSTRLHFPLKCGMNWDALNDILSYTYWLEERRVVIVHDERPELTREELAIYLGVLRHVMADTLVYEGRAYDEIDVVFPLEAYDSVQHAIVDSIRRDELRGSL
ncbi:MAG: barstar family protein [Holophagales bacterium]|nr:barstar family protein [Holophagales bacterium]